MIQLPEFSAEKVGVKDFIVSALCVEGPLSAKQIFTKIKRYGVECSYQAVHKQLLLLARSRIVKKEKWLYSLDDLWIKQVESFIEEIKQKQRAGENIPDNQRIVYPVCRNMNNITCNSAF